MSQSFKSWKEVEEFISKSSLDSHGVRSLMSMYRGSYKLQDLVQDGVLKQIEVEIVVNKSIENSTKKGGDNMKTYKIADVLNGTADVASGKAEKGESKALRLKAASHLKAVGDCMLLSEFVKAFYNRFTRDEYNYARQVFMTRGGIFATKKAKISGDSRERVFLVRIK